MPCRAKGEPRNLIVQYCTMKSKVNPEPRAPSWVFYINYTLLDISNSINLSKCGVETHRSVVSIAHAHPWRVPLPLLQFHCSSRTAAWYRNSICSMLPLVHVACHPGAAAWHWHGFPCARRASSLLYDNPYIIIFDPAVSCAALRMIPRGPANASGAANHSQRRAFPA